MTSRADATAAAAADAAERSPPLDPARTLRAVRRRCGLSQRELAAAAGVTPSVVAAIEAGSRRPGLELFDRIVRAVGHRMVVCEFVAGEPSTPRTGVEPDDDHDAVRDRRGRRFPAHLEWEGKPVYQGPGRWWWGWHRIAKHSDERVPDHVYWQRPREPRGPIRDHPWFGEFRSRSGCFGPQDAACAGCLYLCRYRPEAAE